MARRILTLAGAILLALSLSACASTALPTLSTGMVRAQLASEGMTFTLDSAVAPKINTTQHLRVTLTDDGGRPIDAQSVYFDLKMDMLCLSGSKPVATSVGRGGYEVDVVYVMPGDWEVTAVADMGDHELKTTFPISVTE
ncbi:FixH family protein [Oscillochloris sp. ZM17-4]|uniref:FixH family protein n=1 Tax=Oscillochloris sp. ZM17-4 TaxID=2866714 RepID=UPI001C73C602|nr:FixH family protein [Oscillochloris sp. ZM17-4]MBX0326633.1 FixH family protein [Oscillochloris sp. ZM17-4]